MSSRRFRNLFLLAAAAALAYWFYKDRPTLSGIVDSITNPLLGSRAAVKTEERKRVTGDATVAITEQVDLPVGSLREGMTSREVKELLGSPDSIEREPGGNASRVRWTFARAGRVLVLQDDRVVSIAIR
jgi:hypothetical protein